MDPRNPTFEEVRSRSKNGRQTVRVLMYGSSVQCRAKTTRTRAEIDFDLFSCNYDLRSDASDVLWAEYNAYRERMSFRTKLHPHFSRTSIWFDVHPQHAEEWFQRTLRAIQDPGAVSLCDAAVQFSAYLQQQTDEVLLSALIETDGASIEGTVVRMVAPAWLELVRLIQANPLILNSLEARRFEELMAGAYKRAGFDKVILTPRSGDHGVDVIAERQGLGRIRLVDQSKQFASHSVVTANDVRALGFVALADGSHTKGVVTTTSTFAPRIAQDRFLGPYLKTGRIELVDGKKLLDRLVRLMHGYTKLE